MTHATAAAAASSSIPLTWLLLRTTGVIALVMLTVSTVLGIAGPVIRRPAWRLGAISVHSAAAATGVVLLVGHVIFAVADSYVTISPLAVLVPGVSEWQPLWVGLGTIAFDLLAVLMLTTFTRQRAPIAWRRFHLLAYPAWVIAWGHALTAGTDGTSRPMLSLAAASFLAVSLAGVARLALPVTSRRQHGLDEHPGSDGPPGGAARMNDTVPFATAPTAMAAAGGDRRVGATGGRR